MKYCKKCVSSNQRPGIYFDERGVCAGCIAEEKNNLIDWDERKKELEKLCLKYRRADGEYDCVIAVSGGKDSHFQVYVMKEIMKMNPLLVSVFDNFPMTRAGKHNIKNISETFGCNIIALHPNIKIQKRIMKYTFEKYLKPDYYIDVLIYNFPIYIAMKFGIELIIYGENISNQYGGLNDKETYSALEQMENGCASGIPLKEFEFLEGIFWRDLHLLKYPSIDEMKKKKIEPIYLSYFYRWDGYKNYIFAKSRGFKDLKGEWRRSQHIDDYTQIDTAAYLVHPWLKYPKFGHAYASDLSSRWIKTGKITREEGIELVRKHDHFLDQKCIDEFCEFLDYSVEEFWKIVDPFFNRKLFKRNKWGEWVLKSPIWKKEND